MDHVPRHPGWRRLLPALLMAFALFALQRAVPAQEQHAREAILLDLDGAIGPATADYLHEGLATAAKRGAAAVILRIDTPGGLDTAMRRIIQDIIASPVPVIGYVAPSGARAASAGTYILYGCHLAAMAPGTNLGAATPVQIGGGLFGGNDDKEKDKDKDGKSKPEPTDTHARKAINDAVAFIRGLAQLRGRNADWAEQAVREAASLPATDALGRGVIDLIADSSQDLLAKADGRSVRVGDQPRMLKTAGLTIVEIAPDWRAKLLAVITNPNIAYLLLLAGIYGLLFEFINPGAVAPGVLGGIALLIGLYALNLLPVNYAGAGLVLLGIALMVAEAFLPSFGIVGFGGIVSFALGSLLMFNTDVPGFHLSWEVVTVATGASAAFLLLVLGVSWQAHRREVTTGESVLLGRTGRVEFWEGHQGQVRVHGESWQAQSDAALAAGQTVRVVERRDLTLIVEPLATAPSKP